MKNSVELLKRKQIFLKCITLTKSEHTSYINAVIGGFNQIWNYYIHFLKKDKQLEDSVKLLLLLYSLDIREKSNLAPKIL